VVREGYAHHVERGRVLGEGISSSSTNSNVASASM
jgi:hypothetical protein